jgi:hypothetical protein
MAVTTITGSRFTDIPPSPQRPMIRKRLLLAGMVPYEITLTQQISSNIDGVSSASANAFMPPATSIKSTTNVQPYLELDEWT